MAASLKRTTVLTLILTGGAAAILAAFRFPEGAPAVIERAITAARRVSHRASVSGEAGKTALTQGPSAVTFTITPTATFAISPYIYGANFLTDDGDNGTVAWGGGKLPDGLTLNRMGGNRMSAYNWQLNASNAGKDYKFQNDRYLSSSSAAGDAVRTRLNATARRGATMMVTVPMLPFVAGNADGVQLDTLEFTAGERLGKHFVPNRPTRGPADVPRTVYEDEFVRWVAPLFAAAKTPTSAPMMFSLDNEPDAWHDSHLEVMSPVGGKPGIQTYDGFMLTSIDYARMIKKEVPQAMVFGPALATYTGYLTLGRYPSPDPRQGRRNFLEYYLERFQVAERRDGRRLLDVLDVHWYPAIGTRAGEITNDFAPQNADMIGARLQAPRSLWDSTFDERSWVSQTAGGPVALLPRLKRMIADFYPGTKIAITEYYFGRAGDISGGIAQADVLGIFGREGVYAAALWPQAGLWAAPYAGSGAKAYAFAFGAFQLFRNYDGNGARFGDVGLRATTSDAAATSVYASRDERGRVVLIAINKTTTPVTAKVVVTGSAATGANMWSLREGNATPVKQADISAAPGQPISVVMPPMSASTVVLQSGTPAGK